MSIFDRASLDGSSLADLHAIASELSIDGYRRLRKAELIAAILDRQGGRDEPGADADEPPEEDERPAPRRRRARARPASTPADTAGGATADKAPRARVSAEADAGTAEAAEADAGAPEVAEADAGAPEAEPDAVEGLVEVLPGGSGFIRLNPPEPSDDDVYVSAAQVRRCELVSGDRISGPRRPPRRSERFASLVRVDTVNGRPAAELADGPRFEDMPAAFPTERLRFGSEDPTIKAIEWLAPLGRGSRATIVGPPRAGKSEALRRLAWELAGQQELELSLVLAGVRPEEVPEWTSIVEPAAVATLGSSLEARSQAVEVAIERARRLVARGANAVVLIDSLDAVNDHVAERALASARNVADGGSLTVISTTTLPRGGETTVITLDAILTGAGRFPALDLVESWSMKPELLVGEAAAEAIARARAELLE